MDVWRWRSDQLRLGFPVAHPIHSLLLRVLVQAYLQGLQVSWFHSKNTPRFYLLFCWITSFLTFIILSVQDRQLVQLYGFLLRLHGAGGDQYYPDCWHSWLGSVVRTLIRSVITSVKFGWDLITAKAPAHDSHHFPTLYARICYLSTHIYSDSSPICTPNKKFEVQTLIPRCT